MNIAELDAALALLPATPVTDDDLIARRDLMELRNGLVLEAHVRKIARARARPIQPSWLPVRVPHGGASVYYPANGGDRDPYLASVVDDVIVIFMEPGHARALLTSDPSFRAAQTADLIAQVFPDTNRGPV
jgi:hypothetical protein